jgi:hypothetical protein
MMMYVYNLFHCLHKVKTDVLFYQIKFSLIDHHNLIQDDN